MVHLEWSKRIVHNFAMHISCWFSQKEENKPQPTTPNSDPNFEWKRYLEETASKVVGVFV